MTNIISIKLKRYNQISLFNPDEVKGYLRITYKEDNIIQSVTLTTLENRNYLFPPGHYFLSNQYSPKFNKNLWEFEDIENRTEIKFHQGSKPEHSKGCVLLSNKSLYLLDKILIKTNLYTIKVS